jgi:hypothetical protein
MDRAAQIAMPSLFHQALVGYVRGRAGATMVEAIFVDILTQHVREARAGWQARGGRSQAPCARAAALAGRDPQRRVMTLKVKAVTATIKQVAVGTAFAQRPGKRDSSDRSGQHGRSCPPIGTGARSAGLCAQPESRADHAP